PAGKTLEYTLRGDPYNPTGGEWAPSTQGRFARPFMVWYPDPDHRNIDRPLTSPSLDYQLLRTIIRGDARPVFDPRTEPPPPLAPASPQLSRAGRAAPPAPDLPAAPAPDPPAASPATATVTPTASPTAAASSTATASPTRTPSRAATDPPSTTEPVG